MHDSAFLPTYFPLALGTAPFGTGVPRETAFAILDAYVDVGGNLIDTAAVYGMGMSERTVGQAGWRGRSLLSRKKI